MELIKYNGYEIRITPKGSWTSYIVKKGDQIMSGQSRGTKREIVSRLKWRIDHKDLSFKAVQ